ncbi:hypothetical protein [Paenibacillus hamazuiensis]|uniref:hypothetical protein n=1 Tax=Paenibacillus hamazuiensis TaxID=2936508 RepID=UPI00200D39DD|nr:hypothetical protein [Paenibacillus hamazuiensis]
MMPIHLCAYNVREETGGAVRLFGSIMLALLQPVIVTGSLLTVINVWNDFTGPFYRLTDGSKWTVTVSFYKFATDFMQKSCPLGC